MRNKYVQGFTLIEMTIVMAFLSILLIAILTLTITAGKMYVKGITNKSINQSGREIQDIVRRDFSTTNLAMVSSVIETGSGNVTGRICLGAVSYLWNTAGILNDTTSNGSTYRIKSGANPIRFVRVVDTNASMCVKGGTGKYPTDIPSSLAATELLGGDGRDFALYSMDIVPAASNGSAALYQIRYTVGTNEEGTTDASAGYVQCKTNDSVTADFNYCSVSDFDMIVRVQGGTR
jgi:prepilin-type N-terminal cleavage/methylation domain-containing protein